MRRVRQHLDEIDRQLCELLFEDPRASKRALAAAVGVTDETVAARLRRLRDDNVLTTTVAIDWEAAGYRAGAIARLHLDGRAAPEVASELARAEGVYFGAVTTGCCDVLVALLATDLQAMRSRFNDVVNRIKGLRCAVVDVVTDTPRHALRTLTLPMRPWSPADLPAPVIELDDLDHRLIEQLANFGDESHRELARRLEVSDGTIRARIRRLEDAGLLRVVAGVDPIATGDLRATALVFLTLARSDAADALISSPRVLSASRCLGSADLALLIGSRDEHSLDTFIVGEVGGTAGVRSVEVAHLVEVFAHQTRLVRLVG